MKNFFDCKDEKITEKAFSQSIAISVLSIFLCIVALCSATWAWFSADAASSFNIIESANCEVFATVTESGVALEAVDGKYTLEQGKAYTIELAATGTAKTAYCILNINGENYYTDQIRISDTMAFTLKFTDETKIVEILPCWGMSSRERRDFADCLYYLNFEVTNPQIVTSEQ